jgi:uncharacterized coiled-coil DUF342 family protein
MEQNNHPAKYRNDQEWQEALRDRFDQLHTKISDLSNEATSYKSFSDAWQRKYNEMKQENATLYAKSKNLDELLDELQARCDRYEKALKEIEILGDGATIMHLRTCKKVANEALNGEGEKERCTCGTYFIAAHGNCYRCPENQKEDK